jgi:hypothetical protein
MNGRHADFHSTKSSGVPRRSRAVSTTLGRMVELTKAKPRSIQYWANIGLLRPNPESVNGGRGIHLTFPPSEVRVAAVAAAVNRLSVSAPTLKWVCEYLRPVLIPGTEPLNPAAVRAAKSMQDGKQVYALIAFRGDEEPEIGISLWVEPFRLNDMADLFAVSKVPLVAVVDLTAAVSGLPALRNKDRLDD